MSLCTFFNSAPKSARDRNFRTLLYRFQPPNVKYVPTPLFRIFYTKTYYLARVINVKGQLPLWGDFSLLESMAVLYIGCLGTLKTRPKLGRKLGRNFAFDQVF